VLLEVKCGKQLKLESDLTTCVASRAKDSPKLRDIYIGVSLGVRYNIS